MAVPSLPLALPLMITNIPLARFANPIKPTTCIGLGAVLGKCRLVSDAMILTAAEALATVLSEEDLQRGMVYPDINDIRQVSLRIAVKVIQQAATEEDNVDPNLASLSDEDLAKYIEPRMYKPEYPTLIYQPPGVEE
jgi:malate dehydrogenase (decarboxylating)